MIDEKYAVRNACNLSFSYAYLFQNNFAYLYPQPMKPMKEKSKGLKEKEWLPADKRRNSRVMLN
jgi:hypothetical protein